jgi:hypothetical protein
VCVRVKIIHRISRLLSRIFGYNRMPRPWYYAAAPQRGKIGSFRTNIFARCWIGSGFLFPKKKPADIGAAGRALLRLSVSIAQNGHPRCVNLRQSVTAPAEESGWSRSSRICPNHRRRSPAYRLPFSADCWLLTADCWLLPLHPTRYPPLFSPFAFSSFFVKRQGQNPK